MVTTVCRSVRSSVTVCRSVSSSVTVRLTTKVDHYMAAMVTTFGGHDLQIVTELRIDLQTGDHNVVQ